MITHKHLSIDEHKRMCEKYQAKLNNKHIPSLSFGMVCDDCLIGKLTAIGFYRQICDLNLLDKER
jgi:hypothetical protein